MNFITCRVCQTQNQSGNKFCSNCGGNLGARTHISCPNCYHRNALNLLYCDNCGTRLDRSGTDDLAGQPDAPAERPMTQPFSLPARRPGDTGELDLERLPDWLRTGEEEGEGVSGPPGGEGEHHLGFPTDDSAAMPDWLVADDEGDLFEELADNPQIEPAEEMFGDESTGDIPGWLVGQEDPDEEIFGDAPAPLSGAQADLDWLAVLNTDDGPSEPTGGENFATPHGEEFSESWIEPAESESLAGEGDQPEDVLPTADETLPDWLEAETVEPLEPTDGDDPALEAWLDTISPALPAADEAAEPGDLSGEVFDLDETFAALDDPEFPADVAVDLPSDEDLSAWLTSLEEGTDGVFPTPEENLQAADGIPEDIEVDSENELFEGSVVPLADLAVDPEPSDDVLEEFTGQTGLTDLFTELEDTESAAPAGQDAGERDAPLSEEPADLPDLEAWLGLDEGEEHLAAPESTDVDISIEVETDTERDSFADWLEDQEAAVSGPGAEREVPDQKPMPEQAKPTLDPDQAGWLESIKGETGPISAVDDESLVPAYAGNETVERDEDALFAELVAMGQGEEGEGFGADSLLDVAPDWLQPEGTDEERPVYKQVGGPLHGMTDVIPIAPSVARPITDAALARETVLDDPNLDQAHVELLKAVLNRPQEDQLVPVPKNEPRPRRRRKSSWRRVALLFLLLVVFILFLVLYLPELFAVPYLDWLLRLFP